MQQKKAGVRAHLAIIIPAVMFFSVLLMWSRPLKVLELKFSDLLFEIRGPLPVSDSPIVMVALSDQADEEIPEKYPWPTHIYARLIENLNKAGAKAILFDVIFNSPDLYAAVNDSIFAQALKTHGNVILAGEVRRQEHAMADGLTNTFPLPVLMANNANPVALVRVYPDLDGVIRSYPLGVNYGDQALYMLALEGLRVYDPDAFTTHPPRQLTDTGNSGFVWGEYFIKREKANSFRINYYGGEAVFPVISIENVIDDAEYSTVFEQELDIEINAFDNPENGLLQQGIFKDKIVIVGSTMPLLKDFYATPFANAGHNPRPGYEIHAHAMQTILDGNYIQRQPEWMAYLIMLLFITVAALLNRLHAGWALGAVLLAAVGYFFGAVLAFTHYHYLMVITGPLLAVFAAQITMLSVNFFAVQKEKRRIKGMFSTYVSPELVAQMIDTGQEPTLGGEEQVITAFFSDIENFSTFSELLPATRLVQLVNEYLSAMTSIIHDQSGTLDKYIGDAIVAFYGAPVSLPDHAWRACYTTQLMQQALAQLREKWKQDGWPELVVNMKQRIGINTGSMVIGNMGSDRRFNYTVMGDNVNLAARCEGAAKQYGVATLVTEATKLEAQKFGNECLFRWLDTIVVKGRQQPVKVFEIAGLRDDVTPSQPDCINLYESGMQHYERGQWVDALSFFEKSLMLEWNSGLNPSSVMLQRCHKLIKKPPQNWNGVYVLTDK